MWDLRNGTAHRVSVRSFHHLIEFGNAQAFNNCFVFLGGRDKTPVILDSYRACFCLVAFLASLLSHDTSLELHLFDLFTTQARKFHRILHTQQSVERRSHHVVRIG